MPPEAPWIAHGSETAEHEDFLIGNRAGLEALKSAIERALADGEAGINDPKIEFIGIRVVDQDPRKAPAPVTPWGRLKLALVVLVLAYLAFALLVGLHTIGTWR